MSLILGEHHTATPDVCRNLYEATGWDGTHLHWNIGRRNKMIVSHHSKGIPRYARNGEPEDYCEVSITKGRVGDGILEVTVVPAYDLGYLLRRIRQSIPSGPGEFGLFELARRRGGRWRAGYSAGFHSPSADADNPEDAVALLCATTGVSATAQS